MPTNVPSTQPGDRYGRLVVLAEHGRDAQRRRTYLCVCDCGRQTVVRGTTLRAGATRSCGCLNREILRAISLAAVPPAPAVEDRGHDSPCSIWRGKFRPNGYGRVPGCQEYAHRVAYRDAYGPIPPGWHVHHECGVRACVNPGHLRALSMAEHMRLHRAAERAFRREAAA
jgi:hypothetical protein